MAIDNSIRPTRRALLASLPAVPALTVPTLAHTTMQDEGHMHDLICCAVETGLSSDLLIAATRGLSRPDQRRILSQLRAFSATMRVVVYHRRCNPLPGMEILFEAVGEIMPQLADQHGADQWRATIGPSPRRSRPSGDIMVAIDRTPPPDAEGVTYYDHDVKARYRYLDGAIRPAGAA